MTLSIFTSIFFVITTAAGLVAWLMERSARSHDRRVAEFKILELEEQALLDGLTGLPNRRALDLELMRLMAQAKRNGRHLLVIIVDADRFKAINDTHGHQVGDAVLKAIATTLRLRARAEDFVGRYGGEEFVVVGEINPDAATIVFAQRLCRAIEDTSLFPTDVRLTVSIGAAAIDPSDKDDSIEDTIGRADQALYEAKEAGRNRVRFKAK